MLRVPKGTIAVAIVVLVFVAVGVALRPFVARKREMAWRDDGYRRCRACMVMMDNWSLAHDGRFPASESVDPNDGKRQSWRVRLAEHYYGKDAVGRWLHVPKAGPSQFCLEESRQTTIVALVGTDSAIRVGDSVVRDTVPKDCIVFVETHRKGIDWTSLDDLKNDDVLSPGANASDALGLRFEHGFHVVFADGEVWYLRKDVPLDKIGKLCSVTESLHVDRRALLEAYRL